MLTETFQVETHLLAVKPFRPHPSLGSITGEVVLKWVLQVAAQHGIGTDDVIGAVTDSGGDVGMGVATRWPWEWCLAHLLNRATIDGTGMSLSKEASKNRDCRELLTVITGIVEHFNTCTADKV